MKKRFLSVKTLLSGALAILGFTGCEKSEDTPCAYGMPVSVDYRVVGEITDEAGNPLQGIRVIVENPKPDTIYTDAKGLFQTTKREAVSFDGKATFEDADGKANGGEFATTEIPIRDMEVKQVEKDENWKRGGIEFNTKVQMKKK
jgi:putative lipoprotein (rSAM/lipoprotein system)